MAAHFDPHQPSPQRASSNPRSDQVLDELASVGIAIGAIWAAVLAISLLAPDMVSGSEQQHMAVAAFGSWLWGVVATWAVVGAWGSLRRSPGRHLHRLLGVGVAAVWLVAAAVAVFSPVVETGSDPTRIPVAALVAPIVATVLTALVRVGLDLVAGILADDHGPAMATGPVAAAPVAAPAAAPAVVSTVATPTIGSFT